MVGFQCDIYLLVNSKEQDLTGVTTFSEAKSSTISGQTGSPQRWILSVAGPGEAPAALVGSGHLCAIAVNLGLQFPAGDPGTGPAVEMLQSPEL